MCKDWLAQNQDNTSWSWNHMVVEFTTTCTISAYHHYSCEFKSCSWWGVLDTTLCDKVCQWLVAGLWFSPGTPVSFTNKTDHHIIAEILLKVVLNTITIPPECVRIHMSFIPFRYNGYFIIYFRAHFSLDPQLSAETPLLQEHISILERQRPIEVMILLSFYC